MKLHCHVACCLCFSCRLGQEDSGSTNLRSRGEHHRANCCFQTGRLLWPDVASMRQPGRASAPNVRFQLLAQACTGWQATLAAYGAVANNALRMSHLTTAAWPNGKDKSNEMVD